MNNIFYIHSPIVYTIYKQILENPSLLSGSQDGEVQTFDVISGRNIKLPGTPYVESDGIWDIDKTIHFLQILALIIQKRPGEQRLFLPNTGFLLGKLIKMSKAINAYLYIEEGMYSESAADTLIDSNQKIDVKRLLAALKRNNLFNSLGLDRFEVGRINQESNHYLDGLHPKYQGSFAIRKQAFGSFKNVHYLDMDSVKQRDIQFKNTTLVLLPSIFKVMVNPTVENLEYVSLLIVRIEKALAKPIYQNHVIAFKKHPQDVVVQDIPMFKIIFNRIHERGVSFEDFAATHPLDVHLEPALMGFDKYASFSQSSAAAYFNLLYEPGDFEEVPI